MSHLLEKEQGINLIVADISEEALVRAREDAGAQVVGPQEIYDVECDIFAPCALGGVLNSQTIPRLKCRIVCGSANNQLLDIKHGDALQERGILYAPDYIVNAGGVINVSCEVGTAYSEEAAREKTARIYETTERIIAIAAEEGISTARSADRLAEERLAAARKSGKVHP